MDPPVKIPQLEVNERMRHFVKVFMFMLGSSGERVRCLPFPLSTSLQKYWIEVNQLIRAPLTDPLPWPRTTLSAIRKAWRIDLMSYYWAHNEARQQWWQVLKTLNAPSVISILTEDSLKNYNAKMCNPAQTKWHSLVGSSVKVFFVIQALQACLDRWWKGDPSGPLPGLLLILHMCFVYHDSMHEHGILVGGIYSENSNPVRMIKTETCMDWFCLVTHYWLQLNTRGWSI